MAGRPPRELTDNERHQRDALIEMAEVDGPGFLRDVLLYLREMARKPDPSARRIFRDIDLVEYTHEAVTRIMTDAQQQVAVADNPRARAAATAMVETAAAELRATSSRVKAARMRVAESSSRRWSERILGKVHFKELKFLENLKAEGVGAEEAERRLQEALADEDGLPRYKYRDRAAQLLGRLLREQRNELAALLAEGMRPQEALNIIEKRLARRYGGPDTQGEDHP
ncbi:hypothetical protein [Nonomuraea sp. NPDC023979]|uniref:hypothetical protein n=1 Tax=Nonomuraea sp. NPDC023979 TaxID=3154796 RepID=UPI0033CD9E1C